ncbi:MAG TPA: hypothetical protein VND68_12280 [Chloroflexia bacterium]|nr:hypothetical protein [Chloroflexia bacterium]
MGTNPNWDAGPGMPVPPQPQQPFPQQPYPQQPQPPQPPPPMPSPEAPDERLERFWYLKAPAWLDDWFPQVANALSDGAWTTAWRGVGAYAPLVGFALGLLCRFIFPQINSTFSESLIFMMIVIAVALLSGTMGTALLGGYIVEDLLVGNRAGINTGFFPAELPGEGLSGIAGVLGGKLVSYLLLSIPAVTIPLLVRQLAPSIKLHTITDPNSRTFALAGLHAAIAGVLVFLWAQSVVVLLRPLFTWVGAVPTFEAINSVQGQWSFLVGVGVVAAAGRVLLERMVASKAPRAAVAATLQRQRFTGEGQGILERVPNLVRIVIPPVVIAMLLAGTYDGWLDAIIVAAVVAVLGLWRSRIIRIIPLPSRWSLTIRRIPSLIRLAAAPFIGYWLATLVITPMWTNTAQGLRPVMIGSLVTLIVFYVLFPPLPVVPGTTPQPQPQPQPPR